MEFDLFDFDEYEVDKRLGQGQSGTVNLIKHKNSGQTLAAKVIQLEDSDQTIILREISIMSNIQDQTIVQFRGFSKTDMEKQSRPTIIMDYYEKGSLRNMIEAEQDSLASHSYDNTRKQIILIGIARGMMILHSKRIIHRDLKPENVLLDEYYRPRITDFNLSKFVDSKNSLNQSRFFVGTEGYIAPEVLKSNIYSYKADVYSFGIILFEVLTGESFLPIKTTKSISILDRIKSAPITQAFKNLIEKCCSPDPQMRPTFRELFHKLSLSFEDAEVGEFLIKNALATGSNDGSHDYSLPGVDWDEVRDYLSWIQPQNDVDESLLNALSSIIELETKLETYNILHQARINELNQKHEIRLNEQEKVYQARIKRITNAYQDMITKKDREHQKDIQRIIENNKQEIENLKREFHEKINEKDKAYQKRIDSLVQQFQTIIDNNEKKQQAAIDTLKQDFYTSINKKVEDDFQKIKSLRNKMQRQIDEKRALQQSNASVRDNEVKTNRTIESLKQENINEKEKGFESLHNQYQKKIDEKNAAIETLKQEIENVINENNSRFSALQQQFQEAVDEKDQNHQMELDRMSQTFQQYMKQVAVIRENIDVLFQFQKKMKATPQYRLSSRKSTSKPASQCKIRPQSIVQKNTEKGDQSNPLDQ